MAGDDFDDEELDDDDYEAPIPLTAVPVRAEAEAIPLTPIPLRPAPTGPVAYPVETPIPLVGPPEKQEGFLASAAKMFVESAKAVVAPEETAPVATPQAQRGAPLQPPQRAQEKVSKEVADAVKAMIETFGDTVLRQTQIARICAQVVNSFLNDEEDLKAESCAQNATVLFSLALIHAAHTIKVPEERKSFLEAAVEGEVFLRHLRESLFKD